MHSPEVALWADDAQVDPTVIGGPATAFFLAPDWVLQAICRKRYSRPPVSATNL